MRRRAASSRVVAGVVLLSVARASRWEAGSFPNPTVEPARCGRPAPSRVCDPDGLLGAEGGARVDARLDALAASEFESLGGAGIEGAAVAVGAVAVEEGGEEAEAAAVRDFARSLHASWGVGDEKAANGLVVVVSADQRTVSLSTGRGLRRCFTDGRAGAAVEKMRPALRAGDYAGAVGVALDEAEKAARRGPPGTLEWLADALPSMLFFAAFFGVLGTVAAAMVRDARDRRDFRAARKQLRALDRLRERRAGGAAFSSTQESCPICLEDFRELPRDGAPGRGADGRTLAVLRCGHAFDETCLEQWIRSQRAQPACPICRRSLEDGDEDEAAATAAGGAAAALGVGVGAYSSLEDEVHFRLARLQARYPRYVRPTLLQAWRSPHYKGVFADDRAFLSLDPAASRSPTAPSDGGAPARHFSGGGRPAGGATGRW